MVGYGYAISGLFSYMMGRGRPWYIALGLTLGTISGFAAIQIWRSYIKDLDNEKINDEEKRDR